MILLIDNYDSFVYNLYQFLAVEDPDVRLVRNDRITPEQFGYTQCETSELMGGTPEENAQITKDILSGKERGAKRCAVCLNAGAAIYIAGKAASIEEGVRKAEQIIDDGLALKKLDTFIEESRK